MEFAEGSLPLDTSQIDQNLAATVSNSLLKSNISCVLWGNFLLNIYGVPSAVNSLDFVVPDESIQAAADVLSKCGLTLCTESNCEMVVETRVSRAPSAHFHLDNDHSAVTGRTIDIFPKSSTLGFIPTLTFQPQPENVVPNIILASDPALPPSRAGRGFGGLHAISSPVYIPSIHIFTEAWIREAATAKRGSYVDFAHWMVSYIELYVDEDGLLDTSLLEPRTRTYFLGRKNSTKTIRELFLDLKSAFSAERELVPPVPLRPGE